MINMEEIKGGPLPYKNRGTSSIEFGSIGNAYIYKRQAVALVTPPFVLGKKKPSVSSGDSLPKLHFVNLGPPTPSVASPSLLLRFVLPFLTNFLNFKESGSFLDEIFSQNNLKVDIRYINSKVYFYGLDLRLFT